MDTTFGFAYLAGLFGVLVLGAVVPVLPTGAAVSVAAALAEQDHLLLIALVVMVGAAGAYVSDLGTYAVLRYAGGRASASEGRLGRWLHGQRQGHALEQVEARIEANELRTLLLSRLIPGGQLPVLIAAALGGYSWRRFAVADIGAAVLWSALYAGTGIAGRAIFPEQWEGVAAGVGLVVLVSLALNLWKRRSAS